MPFELGDIPRLMQCFDSLSSQDKEIVLGEMQKLTETDKRVGMFQTPGLVNLLLQSSKDGSTPGIKENAFTALHLLAFAPPKLCANVPFPRFGGSPCRDCQRWRYNPHQGNGVCDVEPVGYCSREQRTNVSHPRVDGLPLPICQRRNCCGYQAIRIDDIGESG